MDSLLVNAIKYASSDKTSPRENFITEVFAWLIRNDTLFAQELLNFITDKFPKDRALPFHPTVEMDVDTQLNFNGVFPDMSWKSVSGDWQILFEHKIWSELHANQLQNYRDYADKFCPPYFMVLITPDRAQHRQNPDVALLWSDIAHCLERLEPSTEMQRHREEFLALLEHVGVRKLTPINPLAVNYYHAAKRLEQQFSQICHRAIKESWQINEMGLGFESPTITNPRGASRYSLYGRIVFNFCTSNPVINQTGQWLPGVGLGFILEGEDIEMRPELEAGPVAALILNTNKSLHGHLNLDGHYQNLVAELSYKLTKQTLWTLYDGTKKASYNRWHPLVVYCNLNTLFDGAGDVESQYQRFLTRMRTLLGLLLSCPSFTPFVQTMQRQTIQQFAPPEMTDALDSEHQD